MKRIRDFLRDRSGATAVTFTLLLVPIMGMTGLAVDYSRASNDRSRLQNAADAAALAGASIFTGANSAAAEARARAYLQANLGDEANAVTVNFSASKQNVSVTIGGQTKTLFMHLLNQDKVDIAVNATALAPLKPSEAIIDIDKVYGWYFKKVSIVVVRPGGTTEDTVGTVTYTAKDHSYENGRGNGTIVKVPATGSIKLGEYEKLFLKMDIKFDGCDIGYYNSSNTSIVKCKASSDNAYKKYNKTLKSSDPATVNHLFVNGTQLPLGSTPPLDVLFDCSEKQYHAWEDGGGFAKQDFFYYITAACKSVDGENVRLTH